MGLACHCWRRWSVQCGTGLIEGFGRRGFCQDKSATEVGVLVGSDAVAKGAVRQGHQHMTLVLWLSGLLAPSQQGRVDGGFLEELEGVWGLGIAWQLS